MFASPKLTCLTNKQGVTLLAKVERKNWIKINHQQDGKEEEEVWVKRDNDYDDDEILLNKPC